MFWGVVVVLTLTRIVKSVVTGQAPVTLELRSTPGKTHTTQGWGWYKLPGTTEERALRAGGTIISYYAAQNV